MKEETSFAVYQSERKENKQNKKISFLLSLTLEGYEVASLFNLPLTVSIAPLLRNSGSS